MPWFQKLNRSARSSSGQVFKSTLTAVFLTASGLAVAQSLTQSQTAVVSNLSLSSGAIKSQITLGTAYSNAIASAANNGTIVDPAGYQRSTITEAQRTAYNAALSTFNNTSFYSAQQLLQAASNEAKTNMQTAIADLANAAADLHKVSQVHHHLSTITDAPTAKAAQAVVQSTGLHTEVTAQHVAAYNTSLANVNSYASQTAAFMRAAQSQNITGNVDTFASQYGKNLDYATAAFAYATGSISVAWADGLSVVQNGVLNQWKANADQFYPAAGLVTSVKER